MLPYLFAHFAKSQLWHASTLLFAFFLTEACGLSTGWMGLIMAGSLVLNGMVDAALGMRWRTRVACTADAVRLQLWGAPVTCLFFVLFCTTPLTQSGYRLVWALVMLMGFRATYPFMDVSQNSVVALAALNDDARSALLAKRNIASGIAAMAVGVIAAPLLIHNRGLTVWLAWAGCLSILVCGTAWWLGRTRMIDGDTASPSLSDTGQPLSFVVLLAALSVMMTGTTIFRTLEPYHAAFAGKGAGLLFWAAVGGLASQSLWFAGRHRTTFTGVLVIAALLLGLAVIGLLFAKQSGAVLAGLGFGMGTGGLWLVLWSALMMRAATGQATRYVGVFTCVSKCAQAAAFLLLASVLGTSPYRNTLADPWSAPSLLMVWAIGAIISVCIVLALNRTASGGRRAPPRPTVRQDQVPI